MIPCSIHENCCNIYPVIPSIICCSICSITLTRIVHLSIQAAIFHSAREIINILTIANSKKLLIAINTDLLRGRSYGKYISSKINEVIRAILNLFFFFFFLQEDFTHTHTKHKKHEKHKKGENVKKHKTPNKRFSSS